MGNIEIEIKDMLFQQKDHKITLLRCCEEWCSPQKKPENRVREYNSLHFVFGGKGTLVYDCGGEKAEVELQTGDSFLLYAGTKFEYYPDNKRPWGYAWIDFTGENVEDIFSVCGYERVKPYVKVSQFDRVRALLGNLIESYDTSTIQSIRCSGYFLILISYLAEEKRRTMNSREEYDSKKFWRLGNVLIYINNNYRRALDVNSVAMDKGISPDYLKHLFIELIGMSFTEYLNSFRIASACERFKMGDSMGVEKVAAEVGYSDPKYFARMFKKIKGMSAREYCKGNKDDDPFAWLKEKNIDYR